MRSRAPSEDEETLEYRRREQSTGGVMFEQMVRQLQAPLRGSSRSPNPAAVIRLQPNVFEMPPKPGDPPPPWAAAAAAVAVATPKKPSSQAPTHVVKRARPKVRKKQGLKIPSLLFLMSLGIGYGLGQDPAARASIVTQVQAAAHATMAFVHR